MAPAAEDTRVTYQTWNPGLYFAGALAAGAIITWFWLESWIFPAILLVATLPILTYVRWRLEVGPEGVRARATPGIFRMHVPLAAIEAVSTSHVDPNQDYQGWGIRATADGRRGVVVEGGDALRLVLTDGNVAEFTTHEAGAMADHLRAALDVSRRP